MTEKASLATVVPFPRKRKTSGKPRKAGLNHNREGSVRKIGQKVYVDFIYLGERVREPAGLKWNQENAKLMREQLDRIMMAIKTGAFRFAEVFPRSRNRDHFSELERRVLNFKHTPDQVTFGEFAELWYSLRRGIPEGSRGAP